MRYLKYLTVFILFNAGCAETVDNNRMMGKLHAAVEGDPVVGYRYMANDNYIGCGIPVEVMKRALKATSLVPSGIIHTLFPLSSSETFADPGIPGRNGINAELAASFNAFETKRGGVAINFNCMSCHSERINGNVVVGLGNTNSFTTALYRPLKAS